MYREIFNFEKEKKNLDSYEKLESIPISSTTRDFDKIRRDLCDKIYGV